MKRPAYGFSSGRAEDDPRAVGGRRPLQRSVVVDATRQLNIDFQLSDHCSEQFGIGTTSERGVKVDQVDPFCTPACQASAASSGAP